MNGDLPSSAIPVTPLATIHSLSNLLTELPLPQPLDYTILHQKSLLYRSQVLEEGNRVLLSQDPGIIAQLNMLLSQTSTEHIQLKFERPEPPPIEIPALPPLMQALLNKNHAVFSGIPRISQQIYYQQQQQQQQNVYNQPNCDLQHQMAAAVQETPVSSVVDSYSSVEQQPVNNKAPQLGQQIPNEEFNSNQDATMRQQIISIGKQPRAHGGSSGGGNRRNRNKMLTELFDSLTPDPHYFKEGNKRRSRRLPDEKDVEGIVVPDAGNDEEVASTSDGHVSPERPETPPEVLAEREKEWQEIMKRRREKRRRRRFQELDHDELVEHESFKQFNGAIDAVFDHMEEYDVAPDQRDFNEEEQYLVPTPVLNDLCTQACKLKALGGTNRIPVEKLSRIMQILEQNMRSGTTHLLPPHAADDEAPLLALMSEHILRGANAALAALYIMTAPNMPKQVFLEDGIERASQMLKFQLTQSIFSAFDPIYRQSREGHDKVGKGKKSKNQSKSRGIQQIYNKLVDVVGAFAELVEVQPLTDTVILQLSSISVSPFFIENIGELQLNALRLVSNIFSRYERHRKLILDDILASLTRLPSNKRSMRTYRLSSDQYIQMISALVMQLVHSVVEMPSAISNGMVSTDDQHSVKHVGSSNKKSHVDLDVQLSNSYHEATKVAHSFLIVYLQKCSTKAQDEDFRPLFEAFVEDLLSAVNKPEWPAAELLLSLLGKLLVQHFSNSRVDMSLRVASLDYLGSVAARLRKDAVTSQLDSVALKHTMQMLKLDDSSPATEIQRTMQRALIEYLGECNESDPAVEFARKFYIAQWYRDIAGELEKATEEKGTNKEEGNEINIIELTEKCDGTKAFLMALLEDADRHMSRLQNIEDILSDEHAAFIARYLASKRPFSQSFDIYLTQILRVLAEQAVAVRTKAMRCLAAVVEADPAVLERKDIQKGVHARLLDNSANVREAAVELLGKFILVRTQLISRYYKMLTERILDTAVSVRKRVIRIMRDICVEQPDFEKIPEICMLIIRRVNDEEGVRKLVNEVFHAMWFAPVKDATRDAAALLKKVVNITDVVAACRETGLEWFEKLLQNLLCKDSEKQALIASKQIVDCLVENVLSLESKLGESSAANTERLMACLSTLFLFAKVKPTLMVMHAETMQPYLSMKCTTASEQRVMVQVIKILELAIPLMEHPDEKFLQHVETNIIRLVNTHGMVIVCGCIACLAAIYKISTNKAMLKAIFGKYKSALKNCKTHYESGSAEKQKQIRPSLVRSLFTVGKLCEYFDIDELVYGSGTERANEGALKNEIYLQILYFMESGRDEDLRVKALSALGYMCVHHHELLLNEKVILYYQNVLTTSNTTDKLKVQVLQNLEAYLKAEEDTMIKSYEQWQKNAKSQDLKELGDVTSGMSSTVIQSYLEQVLRAYYSPLIDVRQACGSVIMLTLQQGLVHPVSSIPHLIAMCTDVNSKFRTRAENILKEIDTKYSGFLHMKAHAGVKQSYALQVVISNAPTDSTTNNQVPIVRGAKSDQQQTGVNANLYSLLRGNRQYRRGMLTSLMKMFDDTQKTALEELIFVADNLALFPYQIIDEPLFIIHQADITVSLSGSNLMQTFHEKLLPAQIIPGVENQADDDDDLTEEQLLARLPRDITPLLEAITASQGCILLLTLKQFLKDLYGITDGRISEYSTTESAKTHDKQLTRRSGIVFHPKFALEHLVLAPSLLQQPDHIIRSRLCKQFVDFKQLMETMDTTKDASDSEASPHGESTPAQAVAVNHSAAYAPTAELSAAMGINMFQPPQQPMYHHNVDPSMQHLPMVQSGANVVGIPMNHNQIMIPPPVHQTLSGNVMPLVQLPLSKRNEPIKIKSNNMYASVLKPNTVSASWAAAIGATGTPKPGRKRKGNNTTNKKKRKRLASDQESEDPEDSDYS